MFCGKLFATAPNFDELRIKAEQGDAMSQFRLGFEYGSGEIVAKDPVEAAKWYRKAAEQGLAGAQWALGSIYEIGKGVAKNPIEAVHWYRKAAEQGIVPAQYSLGVMYNSGEGVDKDTVEAVKWYRKAADQGYVLAQGTLGSMYSRGEGVDKEPVEAAKWYRMAAEQNHVFAQYFLAVMYDGGVGVNKDLVEALKWYRKAAEQGLAQAQWWLGYKYDMGEGVAKDLTEAQRWYRSAAEQGHAEAQYNLGMMHASGEGMAKDLTESAKWYRVAAEQNHAKSQFELGLIYENGKGVPKDSREAFKWYRKAALQNHAGAQCNLGVIYLEGVGVIKDEIEALAWYNLGAAGGSEVAVKNRDALERRLGRDATLVAQQRSKAIAKEIEASNAPQAAHSLLPPPMPGVEAEFPRSSGSGAIVSAQGYVLTAAHVVANARKLAVVTAMGTREAKIVRVDEANDLAILKFDGGPYVPLSVSSSRGVRLGQMVATVGFPNIGIQGFSPKVTRGEISSLNGVADDPRSWQISVPVQPGNSGGPLLDENGNLIGVVVAKLGLKAAQVTGDVPQNVNYAVKSAYALALLEPYLDGKAPEVSISGQKPGFEDMVAKAQQSTVLILAY